MFKRLVGFGLLLLSVNAFAAIGAIEEEDGSPSAYPWKLKVSNGTLTDNGDGTASLAISGGSGDITSVGDVASGAAFDGTQGTTLTFNNAGGDGVLAYDGTNFTLDHSPKVALSSANITIDSSSGASVFVDRGSNALPNNSLVTYQTAGSTNFSTGTSGVLHNGSSAYYSIIDASGNELWSIQDMGTTGDVDVSGGFTAGTTNEFTFTTPTSVLSMTGTTTMIAKTGTTVPAIVRGASGQSNDLFQVQDSTGAVTTSIGNNGSLTLTGLYTYSPIFAPSVTTGVIQTGTLGLAGHVLTSNGDGALPTFKASSGGSGDITDVGDCSTGACFNGTASSGNTLTFDTNGGTYGNDGILEYDPTNNYFKLSASGYVDSGATYSPLLYLQGLQTGTSALTITRTTGGEMTAVGIGGGGYGQFITHPGSGSAARGFMIYGDIIYPASDNKTAANFITSGGGSLNNNVISLGGSSNRWSNLYSVLGNFSGAVTASTEVNVGGTDLGGRLNVDGTADETQLWVQGNGTQTSKTVIVEKSDGTDVFTISESELSFGNGTTTISNAGSLTLTGLSTYSPIFAPAVSTGVIQTGTLGNSGDVLTSNGAGALPTFKALSGGSGDITDVGNCATGACFNGAASSGTTLTFDTNGGTYGADGTLVFDQTNNNFTLNSSGISDGGGAYQSIFNIETINTATNHPAWAKIVGRGTHGMTFRYGADGGGGFVAGRSGTSSGSGSSGAGLQFYGTQIFPITISTNDESSATYSNNGVDLGTSSYRWAVVYATKVNASDRLNLNPIASPPASPVAGDMYTDSTPTPDELCFYDGAAWQGISSGTDANCA